jgi:hypothetical protein
LQERNIKSGFILSFVITILLPAHYRPQQQQQKEMKAVCFKFFIKLIYFSEKSKKFLKKEPFYLYD